MTETSPQDLGLREFAAALRNGTLTSAGAVSDALDRIDASQATLNAFRVVRRDDALAEAADADRRLAGPATGDRPPLLGVPIAVKDDTDVAGTPTAFGCAGEFPAIDTDGEVVRRLREAGAVIVGKTNSCELGQWPFTDGRAFGYTRNPWNGERTPGGSSGGSAAAVAAGLVPAALGSDGAGSIRIPAAWTNLVGIKPQRGRISTWPVAEAFYGITVNGTLARTVADAAWLLDVAAGSHDGDRHRPEPIDAFDAVGRDPGRLRIALSVRIPFIPTPTRLDPEVRAGVERIAATLGSLGHTVQIAEVPYHPLLGASFLPRATAGLHDWMAKVPDPAVIDPRTRANARTGRLMHRGPLQAARRLEPYLQRHTGAIFRDFDMVLAPTTATPPPPVEALDGQSGWGTDKVITAACPYTWPWNVLGWPSVDVPAGFTDAGLPVGVQLMGNANSEPLLLSVAAQLEQELRWDKTRPEPWWATN
ncbi:amidase [Aldersonia sp. NBC_00410]|uniref:amidase n=1 Tax=Aldersonia sp. NBC_00410 TaxID=2975954 RepID=UPI0022586AB7|nr:amidase [Aldersonia sp. NBC_00410]MCX5042713.1 amidase [Aldersonia sp. NBC_00410]